MKVNAHARASTNVISCGSFLQRKRRKKKKKKKTYTSVTRAYIYEFTFDNTCVSYEKLNEHI